MSTTLGQTANPVEPDHQVVIVGAGFGGLCMAMRLQQAGEQRFVVLEKGADVGGTWRVNTYPGCACDVPSHLYSFSFEPRTDWSRMYSPQPEIWDYLRHCVDKHGLRSKIQFNCALAQADFDEAHHIWRIRTVDGQTLTARCLVTAMGGLSRPAIPVIPGIERFEGAAFHSAQWDSGFDFKGKRVAVIGTGASAIQFVPQLQKVVAQLHLVQRTPPWVLPKMDRPITDAERRWMHRLPLYRQLFRWWIYWRQEIQAIGFTLRPAWMDWVQTLGLRFMKKNIKNPALRSLLTPYYRIGCKRILLSNDYYPALAQPNVTVHPASGMGGVGTKGILIDGQVQPVDAIIYGTGFRATDLYTPLKFMGRGGVDLNDTWAATGLQAYQGTLVAGYPNLFLLLGPNTGLGHNSIIFIIEAQVNYILRCIRSMKAQGQTAIEVTPQAQASYNQEVQKRTQGTVWGSGCKSWYLDAAGRNVTLWPGFTFSYWWRTLRLRRQDLRWSRAA